MMYSKLFSSVVHSSLWSEPDHIRLLFITLLALADKDGIVYGSRSGLERAAMIDPDAAEKCDPWERLMGPDSDSSDLLRNPENEGRRIQEIPGGFRLINYDYYKALRDAEERKIQNREAQRRHREKSATVSRSQPASATVSRRKPIKSKSKIEIESKIPKHLNDVLVYAQNINLPASEAEKFYDHFTSNGWRVGGRTAMKDWKAALRNWKRNIKTEGLISKPKEKAPFYPKLPPRREITDQELAAHQRIVRDASEQLKKSLQPF
jgi:hypothetical protein